jgi:hypothetical protein
MQNTWVTVGLVALVVVLLVVLWMRRPRHHHHREPPTIEELVASLERVSPGEADVRPSVKGPAWAVTYVVQATISSVIQLQAVEQRIRLAAAVGGELDGWGTPL